MSGFSATRSLPSTSKGSTLPDSSATRCSLISQVLGGPANYDGRPLDQAHAGLGISHDDLAAVAGHLVAAMRGCQNPRRHHHQGRLRWSPPPSPTSSNLGRPDLMDTAALKGSWGKVVAAGDDVPLYYSLCILFLSHPEVRSMFPIQMSGQRDKLVAALGAVVSNVDELDTVVPLLEQLGRDHRRFAAITEHYTAVGASLLATLKKFHGPLGPLSWPTRGRRRTVWSPR